MKKNINLSIFAIVKISPFFVDWSRFALKNKGFALFRSGVNNGIPLFEELSHVAASRTFGEHRQTASNPVGLGSIRGPWRAVRGRANYIDGRRSSCRLRTDFHTRRTRAAGNTVRNASKYDVSQPSCACRQRLVGKKRTAKAYYIHYSGIKYDPPPPPPLFTEPLGLINRGFLYE
jgi:hypothetical protein